MNILYDGYIMDVIQWNNTEDIKINIKKIQQLQQELFELEKDIFNTL